MLAKLQGMSSNATKEISASDATENPIEKSNKINKIGFSLSIKTPSSKNNKIDILEDFLL